MKLKVMKYKAWGVFDLEGELVEECLSRADARKRSAELQGKHTVAKIEVSIKPVS